MKSCSIVGCVRSYYGRGLCAAHYRKWYKYGDANFGKIHETHNMSKTPEYKAWWEMKRRCYDRNGPNYKDYGARGIHVCERWRNSFLNFYADIGNRPSPSHSIDRIDVNGNYEPGNVQWATKSHQSLNRRMQDNNTSGYIGVSPRRKRWAAQAGRVKIGCYSDPAEAAYVRDQVMLQLFGTNAKLNFEL